MIRLFDCDGTLITSYMDNPDRDYHTWQLLPGRRERFDQLRAQGARIAIITNQGGVAFGHVTEQDFERKIQAVAAALGFANVVLFPGRLACSLSTGLPGAASTLVTHVCYADPRARDRRYQAGHERRKPAPAMLHEAVAFIPAWRHGDALYVGDRREDEQAAQAAGMRFQYAHEYFGEL